MARHTAVFSILLLFCYLSSYFVVIVNRETQAFIQAMLQREGVCALTEPIRAFPRGDYLRNALGNTCEGFLVPDILFWDPTFLFFWGGGDCLSSCIQSGGKTVAGRTTSRVNSMGYEMTCFLSAEFICAKINTKFSARTQGSSVN